MIALPILVALGILSGPILWKDLLDALDRAFDGPLTRD